MFSENILFTVPRLELGEFLPFRAGRSADNFEAHVSLCFDNLHACCKSFSSNSCSNRNVFLEANFQSQSVGRALKVFPKVVKVPGSFF